MSAVACDLYRIKVPKEDIAHVLLGLNLMDMFEPVEPLFPLTETDFTETIANIDLQIKRYSEAINIIESNTKSEARKNNKIVISSILISKLRQQRGTLNSSVSSYLSIADQIETIKNNISQLKSQQADLEPIRDIKHEIFATHELVSTSCVIAPTKMIGKIEARLKEFDDLTISHKEIDDQNSIVIIASDPSLEPAVKRLIKAHQFKEIDSPKNSQASSPIQAHQDLTRQISQANRELVKLRQKIIQESSNNLKDLLAMHDVLNLKMEALSSLGFVGYHVAESNTRLLSAENQSKLSDISKKTDSLLYHQKSEEYVQIDGWLDPENEMELDQKLAAISSGVACHKLDASHDPEVRTILKNSSILRPFELITSLMGTPHPSETDPSPYVAPFFILFFGFALGDAGYGLILSGLALFMLAGSAKGKKAADAFALMLYCGVSTFVFGVLTGSWFGADLQALGSLGGVLSQVKVFDLQTNLMLVLAASLIMGFLHQIFGLLLSIMSHIRSGDYATAILDPGSWLIFLSALVFWGLGNVGYLDPITTSISLPLLWVALAFFAVGQGRGAKYTLLVPLVGLAKLFNLTSYLSNTLSYARLLALALATSVIASVINLLAGMTLSMGLFGYVLAALVLIVGHTFNIVLNVMGTFINVARLHLVEFFPRFFEARGIALEPLRSHPAYSVFAKDINVKKMRFTA